MFNWICPECGREVPPSESECRFCAERKKAAGVTVPGADQAVPVGVPQPAPLQPATQQPAPPQPAQPQPQYSQPYAPPTQQPYYPPAPVQALQQPPQTQAPYYPPPAAYPPGYPPQKRRIPTWLMGLGFGVVFIGVGWVVAQYSHSRSEHAASNEPAPARTKPANALQKNIEVVGIRLLQDARHHPEATFVVVNHSSVELNDLTANVTVWASTSRSEEDAVGTFTFKLDSIGANSSKEMTAPFNTKLKVYELPDWQNATAEVQLTQP